MTTAEPPLLYCNTHRSVATLLRCNKCETPICPRCLVQTPTGARCRNCARLQRSPIYQLTWTHYLRAIGVGAALAVAGGLIWVLLPIRGFFTLLLGWGFGLLLAEAMSRAVRYKRGLPLRIIGAASVLLAAAIAFFFGGPQVFGLPGLLAVVIGVVVVVGRLA